MKKLAKAFNKQSNIRMIFIKLIKNLEIAKENLSNMKIQFLLMIQQSKLILTMLKHIKKELTH